MRTCERCQHWAEHCTCAPQDTVTVNGVVLTRAQVEEAHRALNAPPVEVPHLARVARIDDPARIGVVIRGRAQKVYARAQELPSCPITVIDDNGYGSSYPDSTELLRTWALV